MGKVFLGGNKTVESSCPDVPCFQIWFRSVRKLKTSTRTDRRRDEHHDKSTMHFLSASTNIQKRTKTNACMNDFKNDTWNEKWLQVWFLSEWRSIKMKRLTAADGTTVIFLKLYTAGILSGKMAKRKPATSHDYYRDQMPENAKSLISSTPPSPPSGSEWRERAAARHPGVTRKAFRVPKNNLGYSQGLSQDKKWLFLSEEISKLGSLCR